ncbi:hypothetical protein [Nocardia terpenica]|uniref:Uncharacterized protein n=1 Tax=Nocardia terpenica TaxID=455432 RepID=A0A291RP10_9NOCA|nr:hypothetical protein [Nocardia terpenica]ATL69065.1 hypothetical protein CRH09_25700 [Nocardia terpenica]
MKIACVCGGLIVDNTDYVSNKAHLIADQDWDDALDDAAGEWHPDNLARKWSRLMWQCRRCGRLYVDDPTGTVHRFDPAESTVPHDLLASARGARWPGFLRGRWQAPVISDRSPGELWWQCGKDDSGFEDLVSWEELERRYYEEFQRLHDLGILRSAFLWVDGGMSHQWSSVE